MTDPFSEPLPLHGNFRKAPSRRRRFDSWEEDDFPRIKIELKISDRYRGEPFYYFSDPEMRNFVIELSYTLKADETITIPSGHTLFDPKTAFQEGCIVIVDLETRERVAFCAREEKDRNLSPANDFFESMDRDEEKLVVLKPNETHSIYWCTNLERVRIDTMWNLTLPVLDLKASNIKPNREYQLRYQSHGIQKWFWGDRSKDARRLSKEAGESPSKLLIQNISRFSREPDTDVNFQTRLVPPSPPPLLATIWASSKDCDLSGDPPFTVFVDWTLSGNRPIQILLELKSMSELGLKGHDAENKESCCFRYSWEREKQEEELEFLQMKPGDIFRQSYTFTVGNYPQKKGERQLQSNARKESNTSGLTSGWRYWLDLEPRNCKWLYEDEVNESLRQSYRTVGRYLDKEPLGEYTPDCSFAFWAAGNHPDPKSHGVVTSTFIPGP
jgi:hypothetical protein